MGAGCTLLTLAYHPPTSGGVRRGAARTASYGRTTKTGQWSWRDERTIEEDELSRRRRRMKMIATTNSYSVRRREEEKQGPS